MHEIRSVLNSTGKVDTLSIDNTCVDYTGNLHSCLWAVL